jgi:probable addiction module antidote protein
MKNNKVRMSDYKSYDEFEKEWFKEDPKRIEAVKKEMIKEYNATSDMKVEDLLFALQELMKLNGIANLAKKTNLNREHLYKAISLKGNPTIHTVDKVANELGYRLALTPISG